MADATVLVEIKDTGTDRLNKKIRELTRQITELGKAETASGKKQVSAARSRKRLTQDQSRTIREGRAELLKTNAAIVKMGRSSKLIDQNVKAFNRFQNAVATSGKSLNNLAQATGNYQRQLSATVRTTEKASRGIVRTGQGAAGAGRRAKKGAGEFGKFNTVLADLGSTAVLAVGPLSGIGARIIALGAIAKRSGSLMKGLRIAIPIGILTALAIAVGKGIKAFKDLEVQMNTIRAVLRATGKDAQFTADSINEIVERIDLLTLGGAPELRRAAAQLVSFTGVDKTNLERVLSLAQDISALGFTNLETAARNLGRAFEAPSESLEVFRRVGITFSAEEKALIQVLETFNRKAEATAIILDKFSRLEGVAREQAKGLAGAIDTLSFNIRKLFEDIGEGAKDFAQFFVDMANSVVVFARQFIKTIGLALATVGLIIRAGIERELSKEFFTRLRRNVEEEFKKIRAIGQLPDIEDRARIKSRFDKPSDIPSDVFAGKLTGEGLTALNDAMKSIAVQGIELEQTQLVLKQGFRDLSSEAISFASSLVKGADSSGELTRKILRLNPEVAKLNELASAMADKKELAQIFQDSLTPMEKFGQRLARLNHLLQKFPQHAKAIKLAIAEANPFIQQLTAGFEEFGVAAFRSFREAADGTEKFRAALKTLVDKILDMIIQVLVLEPLVRQLKETLGGAVAGSSKGSGFLGIFGTLLQGVLGGIGGGIGATSTAGATFVSPPVSPPPSPFFAAHGLEGKVGGVGGTDSQLIPLRVTPGEEVSVKTKSQQRESKRGGDTFIVDLRGADKDAVMKLEQLVRSLDASFEQRSINAVRNERARDPKLFG